MVEFVDASLQDLVQATEFLHLINPSLGNKIVFAIEKIQPKDRNVMFHITDRKTKEYKDDQVILISSEYILDHPFWKSTV